MFDLILVCYLSYKNGTKAKLKGQNAIAWGVATAVAYIAFMIVGFFFVIYNFCKDEINLDQLATMDKKASEALAQRVAQSFEANQLHLITVELFGVGGFLLVRYILDKKPDHKEPDMHWMDRVNNDPMA